jgi:hypothetical protein
MATDLDAVRAEIARREGRSTGEGLVEAGKAAFSGAASGATNLLGFIPEVASIPLQAAGQGAPTVPGTNVSLGGSPTAGMRGAFQIPSEPKSGVEQAIYRFTEGAAPAAAVASPAYLAGPVVGTLAVGGAALVGGLSNLAAKGLFPESPTGQMLVGVLPGLFTGGAGAIRRNVPSTQKPSVAEETGIPMTGGQRTGSERLLRTEADVAKSEGGAPIFQRFGLAQADSAEDFASKIQQFSANKNLTATDINKGVIDAVNYQNNRIVNKFRAQNRVNFAAAEKAAGKERIFETNGLNKTLDDQIAYYSAEGMPIELRQVADQLKSLKSQMSKQEQPSVILGADGQPASVTPAQTQKLTIAELQKNLESWGKAAKTGEFSMPGGTDNVFKGVAPGTVKGIARKVLNGFRDDLDTAVQGNVRGAKELSKARDDFKDGLKQLDSYAETPFVKKFMKDNPSALDPTETVQYLTQATPTERVVMLNLLESNRPDIVASLRNRTMQQVLDDANGDTNKLLTNLKAITAQKSEAGALGLNDFLFKTPGEKAKVKVLVRDLESITKKPVGPSESLQSQMQGTTTEVAAVGGGWTVGKAVAAIQDTLNMVSGSAASSEKLAWMMTNPQGQSMLRYLADQKVTNKPLPQTYADTLNFLSKYSAVGTIPTARQELPEVTQPSTDLEAVRRRIQELEETQQ